MPAQLDRLSTLTLLIIHHLVRPLILLSPENIIVQQDIIMSIESIVFLKLVGHLLLIKLIKLFLD